MAATDDRGETVNLPQGMSTIGTFQDEELVAGDEESRRRAREERRRQQRLHFAESSNWPRLDLADLRFGRFVVEDTRTAERYRVCRGEVMDAAHSPVTAWFIGTDGGPVFLEPSR